GVERWYHLKGYTVGRAEKTRKEKESLQERMDILEGKYEQLESLVVRQPSSPQSEFVLHLGGIGPVPERYK
ncbi:hypothetical protein HAX54_042587, partial [Datura stramonium]|nr:hypothetical protein [Datura stramonium]